MPSENTYKDFDEYLVVSEPHKRERAKAWKTAIGLQAVDGLHVSEYLKDTARKHIEGELTIDEAQTLVKQYYVSKTQREDDDDEKEEADRVSTNIAKLLNERSFTFSSAGAIAIHRAIFEGVFKHAGKLRDYDITKKEWVLGGDTVLYGRWQDLRMALDYDIEQEKQFDYKGLTKDEAISHIARFVSGIWQIHPFREGNTRTTAVFTIKYLQSIGFNVDNTQFEEHSWYFRNALVRANYKNVAEGVSQDVHFLELFFRNLLLGESHELKNRYMHIHLPEEMKQPEQAPEQVPEQVEDKLHTDNVLIIQLIKTIGHEELSVSQIMARIGLKHRPNFIEYHLSPAITEGYVRMLYPNSPRHPRQKYLLTIKGMTLYNERE